MQRAIMLTRQQELVTQRMPKILAQVANGEQAVYHRVAVARSPKHMALLQVLCKRIL